MTVIEPPKITKCSKKPYTKVTWLTDFERFGIQQFSPDMVSLMVRRAHDIAGVTDKQMSVFYNGEKLKIKSFQDHLSLYPTAKKHSWLYRIVGKLQYVLLPMISLNKYPL